ncbi:DUF3137 domain-containing protein [Mycoplasmatota bacterium]|nr:DUF3137 domain-containing protein [Mycoplasmatota bacterium]
MEKKANSIEAFNQRKKVAEKNFIYAGLIILLAIIMMFIVFSQGWNDQIFIIPIIILVVGLVFLGIGGGKFSKVKKEFKEDFLTNLFDDLIPGIQYRPKDGLDRQVVYSGEFLKKADRYYCEDYLEGKIDDIDFVSSDVRMEERRVRRTKNGTQVYYVPYFIGRIFRFDFHKELTGSLQVLETGSPYSRRRFKKVELESIDFNKKFKTFAEEEHTAFYILTPDIMESIFALEKRHPGNISFSFLNQQLYLAINNNKNTFEIKLFKKVSQEMVDSFKKDLLVIKDVIHTLKLNNSLFKKRED